MGWSLRYFIDHPYYYIFHLLQWEKLKIYHTTPILSWFLLHIYVFYIIFVKWLVFKSTGQIFIYQMTDHFGFSSREFIEMIKEIDISI